MTKGEGVQVQERASNPFGRRTEFAIRCIYNQHVRHLTHDLAHSTYQHTESNMNKRDSD
jgi:hypothetical protein